MKSLIAIVALLVIFAGLLTVFKVRLAGAAVKGPWPFYAKKPLSTPEQVLYFRLVSALPDHIVLAQVQLSRFLGVKKSEKFHQWNNRINRKSVDFLVCSKDSTVVLAIELDDSTHAKESRIKADSTKDKALGDAGIRIVRWNVKSMPDVDAIKFAVAATCGTSSSALPGITSRTAKTAPHQSSFAK